MGVYGVCLGMGMSLRKASYWLSAGLKPLASTKVSSECFSWLYGLVLRLCVCSPAFTRSIPSGDFTTIRLNQASYGF